jgi:hypothetical protein
VAVEAKFWLLTRGDAPLNERHCGPSFGVSDNGDFVPYKSYYREGRWRWVAGAPLKYYRYLSDKFGVFKDGQSEDMGSI